MFYKEKFPLPRCYGCALLCYTASNVCACANVVMTRWRVRGVLSGGGGTKLPHTSYKQPHNPVNTVVLKAYDLFGKAQNRMVNQQATRS